MNDWNEPPKDRGAAKTMLPEAEPAIRADVLTLSPHHPNAHGGDHAREDKQEHENPIDLSEIVRAVCVALSAAAVWFRVWEPFAGFSVIGVGAILVGGYPVFRHAVLDLTQRRMTMELSMTIALGAALAIGEFFTVLVILFFVLAAEMLEGLTVGRGRRAIRSLLDLLPRTVNVRRGGEVRDAAWSEVHLGEIVVVKPGARVPVDGVVVAGHSFVDQSAITGESLPIEKIPGATVFAGTVNQSGAIEVRVKGLGRDTAFGKIIEAVEHAEKARAPIQKTADRLAGYMVYFALACAAVTLLVTHNARSTISVIIVAGACGVAAGTPLAILGAIGTAARLGAIVKGGVHIEALWAVDTVVLDKTGTLTFGVPEVVGVLPAMGVAEDAVLEAAATAERPSEHPLAGAVLRAATARGLTASNPERFEYSPGKGVSCAADGHEILVGNRALLEERRVEHPTARADGSEVHVARDGRYLGSILVADTLRPEAVEAVRRLREMGLRTVLLTGDAASVAEIVGKKLGVDEIGAELLPEAKLERVKQLAALGRRVAMVGDGVNDAPALMQASVGIAMGSGTEVARESAGVLLLGNDLLRLTETIRLARRCRRIVLTNFAGTLIVDGVGVGLAAFGLLNPVAAAFIHVSSELAFILNSSRLLPTTRSGRVEA